VAVVALPREFRAGVTVHAAGMLEDRRHLAEYVSSFLKPVLRRRGMEREASRHNDSACDGHDARLRWAGGRKPGLHFAHRLLT
jgi:hypothetical protein